jgi:peptidyl-prolyl cis-trans isomerase B (cyclophilin B)
LIASCRLTRVWVPVSLSVCVCVWLWVPASARSAEGEGGAPQEKPAAEQAAAAEPAAESTATESTATESTATDPALAQIDAFIAEQAIDRSSAGWKGKLEMPPTLEFDPTKRYLWDVETSEGPLVIQLNPKVAPIHTSSTIYLTRLGFYDGTLFHRVIPRFMAQGGDPTGTGRGGPGYEYAGEFSKSVRHDRPGLLSMANAGPGTDGSQFFLTFVATPHLDGKHTIFGEVIGGTRTLQKLEAKGTGSGRPTGKVEIVSARVRAE